MIYVAGLFFILGLVFWLPIFIAMTDMYVWYFFSHNLTGLDYGGEKPLVMLVCFFLGFACMGIAGNAAE